MGRVEILALIVGLSMFPAGCDDDGDRNPAPSDAGGGRESQARQYADPREIAREGGGGNIQLTPDDLPRQVGPAPIGDDYLVSLVRDGRGLVIDNLQPKGTVWMGSIDEQWQAHGQWIETTPENRQVRSYWWHGEIVTRKEWHKSFGAEAN